MGTCCYFQIIKDADNDVGQLAPEIVTVISQVAGSWLDNIFNSAEHAKDDDKLIPENKPPVSHEASQASASGTRMSYKSVCGSPILSDLGSMEDEVEHAPVSPPPSSPEWEHTSGHGLQPEVGQICMHYKGIRLFLHLGTIKVIFCKDDPPFTLLPLYSESSVHMGPYLVLVKHHIWFLTDSH